MASTVFSTGTVIASTWLNDVNTATYQRLSSVSGTNTILATGPATVLSYSTNQAFEFIAANSNTGPVTINISSLGPIAITKTGAVALASGDISVGQLCRISYDGTRFQLLNPASSAFTGGTVTNDITMSGAKINFAKGADIASASTVNLSTATGNTVNLTGTTPVTSWTMLTGQRMRVQFTAATPITYNAATNQIQGGSSITGEVGSYLEVYYDGTTTFVTYILTNGAAASGPSYTTVPSDITTTGAVLTANAVGVVTKVNSASATTTTLMAVSTLILGQSFTLANIGVGIATFTRAGSDTITGNNLIAATSISLNNGESVTLTCTATGALLITGSNVPFFGRQIVRLVTNNGSGSTNTAIRRFLTTVTSLGTDITYTDSATLGATFTINIGGVYSISYTDSYSGAANTGISLNSSQLTTAITSVTATDVLAVATTAAANTGVEASWSGYLPTGSIIRAHGNVSTTAGTQPALFTIARMS